MLAESVEDKNGVSQVECVGLGIVALSLVVDGLLKSAECRRQSQAGARGGSYLTIDGFCSSHPELEWNQGVPLKLSCYVTELLDAARP
jgi:hypothetical protein